MMFIFNSLLILCALDLSNLDDASKRLKYIVDTLGVKQSHMAEKLGLSPSGLHYILNNDVKFSKNAKKIAEYLNVNEEWLVTGKGAVYEENMSAKTYKIPVYYPDQLKLYFNSNKEAPLNTTNYLITTTAYQNKMIAIYITEKCFSSKFEPGDIAAFQESPDFQDGEILLVFIKKTNSIRLFNGFHLNEKIFFMAPDEENIKKLEPAEDDSIIIGSYRESLKRSNII